MRGLPPVTPKITGSSSPVTKDQNNCIAIRPQPGQEFLTLESRSGHLLLDPDNKNVNDEWINQQNNAILRLVKMKVASDKAWHLVHTKPRQEFRAEENLVAQGFEVFLPRVQIERKRRNRVVMVEEGLFPRYLFVCFDESNDPWHLIRNTLGVSALVRVGMQPACVPASVIESLKSADMPIIGRFQAGDKILVSAGPFKGFEGIFMEEDGKKRAMILIEFLNKTQRIRLDPVLISPAGA